jgi:hypothetical protein
MGWMVVTNILCWTNGRSTIPKTNTFGQIIWWSGYVCWTMIRATITSTGFISCWKLDLCEGLRSKLCSYSNWVKSWLHSNPKYVMVGFKFKCILTNNRCWLKGHNYFGNVVTGCYRLPSLSFRCFVHSVVHSTSVVGMTVTMSKINQLKILVVFFFLLCKYLMERYLCYNKLLRLIVESFNQLYSLSLKMWLLLLYDHFMNMLLWHF